MSLAAPSRPPAPAGPTHRPSATEAPTQGWLQRQGRRVLPSFGLGAVLAYLVLVPLALLIWSSFKPTGLPTEDGFTLEHYVNTYGDPRTFDLVFNSFMFSVGSSLVALVLGTALAWLTERTDLPGRGLLRAWVILPMALPPVLLAISWVLLASPEIGALNGVTEAIGLGRPFDVYSMPGMIFVQGLSLVPTAYLVLSPAFKNMDPTLEEAALASGASPTRVVLKVVLPLVRPALLASAAFLLILGFVVFDIPGTLGVPRDIYVLSSEIFNRAQPPSGLPDYGGISALATSFLVVLLALSWFYSRQTKAAQKYTTIGGKSTRPRRFSLGRWRWPLALFAWLYIGLAAAAPFVVLVLTSLAPFYRGISGELFSSLTLRNHQEVFSNPAIGRAALNSLVIAVVAATVVAGLSALVSWVSIRSDLRGRRFFDVVSFLPIAIPSVMMGLALVYVYLTIRVIPIYGTIWILVIAYTTSYLSFGTRVTNGVLLQMSKELEESAATSGAGFARTFRRITLPLMRPAMVSVWIWVAAHALRELSAALLLQGRSNAVVPTILWGYWESARPTTAAAVGVWLIVVLAVLVGLWGLVSRRSAMELP